MISQTIHRIRFEATGVFSKLVGWCMADDDLLNYRPPSGWSVKEILEHITLTNHYLLLIIKKGVQTAVHRAKSNDVAVVVQDYVFDWDRMNDIGRHGSFDWIRPEHMEPTGNMPMQQIRDKLMLQLNECMSCLDALKNGEGALYKVKMSVNDLGKIDMYHYLYFLVQHAKRHITQMEKIKSLSNE